MEMTIIEAKNRVNVLMEEIDYLKVLTSGQLRKERELGLSAPPSPSLAIMLQDRLNNCLLEHDRLTKALDYHIGNTKLEFDLGEAFEDGAQ